MNANDTYDVLIVGGGPAGLSAALVLGRCRRRVLVCDTGEQRNRWARNMHNFLSRDGMPPKEFLDAAQRELTPYDDVARIHAKVMDIEPHDNGFKATLADGRALHARKLLLATGVVDHVPKLPGIDVLYGRSVHHRPYCDGWEWRDKRIAAYGRGDAKGAGLALMLLRWSSDIVLLTNGAHELSDDELQRLDRHRIAVNDRPIARLDGDAQGLLRHVVFDDGTVLDRDAMFFNTGQHQHDVLAKKLGCRFTERGGVQADHVETGIPGLYVAGDATRDVQFVIVAASEGAQAGVAINKALMTEEGLC
ncbi:MAG TPA: NAD(P)/FAD-dependent oxidoreductase [Burkholderiaceae bacterium]|nr:NAD(P)/FAD-dependent oxidoreductase [Burkholderiaceae bacterium]